MAPPPASPRPSPNRPRSGGSLSLSVSVGPWGLCLHSPRGWGRLKDQRPSHTHSPPSRVPVGDDPGPPPPQPRSRLTPGPPAGRQETPGLRGRSSQDLRWICFLAQREGTMAEMTALETMMEMGFSRNRAEKALALSGDQGIEKAMDWLIEHEDDPTLDDPYVPPQGHVLGTTEKSEVADAEMTFEENSSQIQQNTSLSEEEKREQLKRLEELMKQRQLEREEREKKEEIDREKQRRKQGQELSLIRQKLQEEEMRKIAEERRREKLEDIRAKQRVREKIERDKAERALKFGGGTPAAAAAAPPVQPTPAVPQSSTGQMTKREYNECRLQIRLLDGSQLTQSFKSREQLAAVRLYVQLQQQDDLGNFNLMTSFPRKVFSEEDMEKPLQELGLVPSAVLFVCKK